MSENSCSVHTPHVSPCTESSGFAWVCPQPEEIVTNRQQDFAPPDDTDGARWLDHLRARATSADADSMPELGHGLWKPWHWPWSGRRPWTEWPSAFGRRALFSLSSAFGRTAVTTSPAKTLIRNPPRGKTSRRRGRRPASRSEIFTFLFRSLNFIVKTCF